LSKTKQNESSDRFHETIVSGQGRRFHKRMDRWIDGAGWVVIAVMDEEKHTLACAYSVTPAECNAYRRSGLRGRRG